VNLPLPYNHLCRRDCGRYLRRPWPSLLHHRDFAANLMTLAA
jgi:hypothetical protein